MQEKLFWVELKDQLFWEYLSKYPKTPAHWLKNPIKPCYVKQWLVPKDVFMYSN